MPVAQTLGGTAGASRHAMGRTTAGYVVLSSTFLVGCVADVDILDTDPPEVATLASHAGAKNATGYADTFFAGGDHSKTGPFFAAPAAFVAMFPALSCAAPI